MRDFQGPDSQWTRAYDALRLLRDESVFERCSQSELVALLATSVTGLDNAHQYDIVMDAPSPTVDEAAVRILERLTGTSRGEMPIDYMYGRIGHEHAPPRNATETRRTTLENWRQWWSTAKKAPDASLETGRRAVTAIRAKRAAQLPAALATLKFQLGRRIDRDDITTVQDSLTRVEHVATKWPSKTLPLWQLVLDDAPIPSDFVQSLIDHDPAAVKELVERRTASFNAVDGDYACEVHMTAYSRPAKPLLPPLTLDNAQIDALAERATHIAIVATHRNLGEEAETIELYSFAQLRGPTLDGMTVAVEVVPKTPAAERLRLHTKLIGFFRQDANGRFALIDQTLGVIPLTRALALRLHR